MPKISPRILVTGASALWLLIGWTSVCAQTTNEFRTRPNQIVVNAQRHWEDWDFPAGTLEIAPQGEVRPRQWNRNTAATEDIVDFLRFQIEAARRDPTLFKIPKRLQGKEVAEISLRDAVVEAGSNPAGVTNVLDGDPTTFWEPAPLPAGVDPADVDVG
ncbi:MAG: hypothetical protein OXI35_13675, partial [Gemmatimonadota bacterium]|nr:hypothetical protein [Gemmatimonadota bacterium]